MHVNTTKSGFMVNQGIKNIASSYKYSILKIETFVLFSFECEFHFRITNVQGQLNLSFRLKNNKNIVHITYLIARIAF